MDFQSPLSLQTGSGPQLREIRVADGAATVDAKISGIISSSFGLVKTGPGTLELSAANTYRGATQIDGGTLLLTGTIVVQSSGEGSAFYVNNGSTLKIGANGVAGGHPFFVSAGSVDFTGAFSYTAVGLTMGGGAAGTTSSVTTGATGTMAIGNDGVFYNGHFNNDNGATISGNLALTSATDATVRNRTFTVGNSVNATNDLSISAVISNGGTCQSNGLTKLGPGTLNLSGTSTYTGLTTVSAGTLAYGVSDALSSGAVTVAGGTLDLSSFSDTVGAVTLSSGSIVSSTGVLTGTSYALTNTGSVSAILAGTAALTKTGAAQRRSLVPTPTSVRPRSMPARCASPAAQRLMTARRSNLQMPAARCSMSRTAVRRWVRSRAVARSASISRSAVAR